MLSIYKVPSQFSPSRVEEKLPKVYAGWFTGLVIEDSLFPVRDKFKSQYAFLPAKLNSLLIAIEAFCLATFANWVPEVAWTTPLSTKSSSNFGSIKDAPKTMKNPLSVMIVQSSSTPE